MRILIADDNTVVRVDLRAILGELGHTVCGEAHDGFDAVELAGALRPDVAVLDVRMPRLHGVEAVRRIVRARPIPIVIVTGYTNYTLPDLAAAVGVSSSYLIKPFAERDVELALVETLARRAPA